MMDPATTVALLKIAAPLATSLITLLRTAGRPVEAAEIEAILERSDRLARSIMETARRELTKDQS